MRNTTLATAMHEAEHAVVQLANPPAPYIDSVSIVGLRDGLLGLVDTSAQWQPYMAEARASAETVEAWRRLAWRDIVFHLAGPIAELRWRRWSRLGIAISAEHFADVCLGQNPPELGTDLDRVGARLRWAYPGDEAARFKKAWQEAEEAVAGNWSSIRAIGRILHRQGVIDGQELTALWVARSRAPGPCETIW